MEDVGTSSPISGFDVRSKSYRIGLCRCGSCRFRGRTDDLSSSADDEEHFGDICGQDPVSDGRTSLLEPGREVDVCSFIESSPEFDHRRDFLAVPSSVESRPDDGALDASAVQRHLDCEHVGIGCSLLEQGDDRSVRLVRVVEEEVSLTECHKTVRLWAEGLLEARCCRQELEVWPIDQVRECAHAMQVHGSVDLVDLRGLEVVVLSQVAHGLCRAVVRDLKPHGCAEIPTV